MSHRTYRRAAMAVVAVALALAAGCGSDESEEQAGGTTDQPAVTADAPEGVPEECQVFPFAMPDPDLADVALLPAGFPDPPVSATLCETGGTGGEQEYASYATSAGSEEVLAGYEDALAEYGAVRGEDGVGEPIVTATVEDVFVQVSIKDGGYSVVLAKG